MNPPLPPGRRQATACVGALMLWLGIWLGIVAPPVAVPPWVPVLILWLPLLPALPLLWRGRRGACIWSSMIGVFYAGFAIVEVTANPPERALAAITLALALLTVSILVRCARRWPVSVTR
ncbi:MAG: DUF2069 domain-containing protein [Gammaproteobacteria bacterium]